MARKDDGLSELRSQVLKRQRAATRKVNRLTKKGVEIAGTKADVRRDSEKIKRYNRTQLNAHLNRLNTFTDRKTQYVPDTYGRPVRAEVFKAYKATEIQLKKIKDSEYSRFKDTKIPGKKDTVDDRMKRVTAKFRHAGSATNSPFVQIERDSKNFRSEAKMRQLTAANKKKLKTNFIKKDLKTDREVVEKQLTTLGRQDLIARVKKLNNDAFNALFNFWGFIEKISLPYETAQATLRDGKDRSWFEDQLVENMKEAEKLVGHAENFKLGS